MLYWAAMGILIAEIRNRDPGAEYLARDKFLEIHSSTGYRGVLKEEHAEPLWNIYETYKAKGMH